MLKLTKQEYIELLKAEDKSVILGEINAYLDSISAIDRTTWALENLPGTHILSSSFGIQAAVMLHLCSKIKTDIPVVLTDTGYLFPETYQFIDHLSEKLQLNLKTYRSDISPAWQEARFGKLWEQGIEGLDKYNKLNKVKPMQEALSELNVKTWFAGLRRDQTSTRKNLPVLAITSNCYKMLPIIDWNDKDIYDYLTANNLPYHPLWEKNYISVGDVHSTKPLTADMDLDATRFNGLKRECGLHFDI